MTVAEPVVIDASAFLRFQIGGDAALTAVRAASAAGEELVAPDLIYPEVGNGLRRYVAKGTVSIDEARAILADLRRMVSGWPLGSLFPGAFEIAMARGITPYDAAYVGLAEALGVPVITADRRLAAVAGSARFVG